MTHWSVPHFEVYEERDAHGYKSSGLWRWRFVSPNNRVTAVGGEGYAGLGHVNRAVRRHVEALGATWPQPVEIITDE